MSVQKALTGLAVGRLVLGSLVRVTPRGTTSLFGARHAASPELDYMNRIFGARAPSRQPRSPAATCS